MKKPTCPNCQRHIPRMHGLKMWNPWKCKCPFCDVTMETGWFTKTAMILAVPFGFAIAAVAIIQEESGRWQQADSFLFFGIVVTALLAVGLAAWPKTAFRIKANQQNRP